MGDADLEVGRAGIHQSGRDLLDVFHIRLDRAGLALKQADEENANIAFAGGQQESLDVGGNLRRYHLGAENRVDADGVRLRLSLQFEIALLLAEFDGPEIETVTFEVVGDDLQR